MELTDTCKQIVDDITAILDKFMIPLEKWELSSVPFVRAYFLGIYCEAKKTHVLNDENIDVQDWPQNPIFQELYIRGILFQRENKIDPTTLSRDLVHYGLAKKRVARKYNLNG